MAITNNPAMDDSWSFSEQLFTGSFFFDVRANDSIKKPLHSIDNGQAADLVTADLARSAAASSDRSALGATIWITSDGRVGYSANSSLSDLVDQLGAGETLTDSFLYAVKQGSNIVWATVRVTITGTNDAPVATADVAVAGEDSLATGSVATNDHDVDHGAVLQFATTGQPPAGFALASNGSWAFDGSNPAYQALGAGETMQLAIAYTVTDEHGATSSATLQLAVTGTNDVPTVSGAVLGMAAEGGASVALDALANAGDVDANTTLSVVDVPAAEDLPAGITYDPSTGKFTLDPSHPAYQQLASGQTTVVTVSYGVSDGTATTPASVSWTISGTNDGPVAAPAAAGVAEDQSVSGQLAATDPDSGASLTFAPVGDVPAGFALASDGSWAFDANQADYQALAEGEERELAVSYSVTDEHGATSSATLQLTVTGTNDAPTVSGAVLGTAAEGGVSVALDALANAGDVDANATLAVVDVPAAEDLPAGVTYDPSTGKFTLDSSHPTYQQLASGQTTVVTVSYGVSDGTATTPASVSWTVTGTNDGPVAAPAAAAVAEDQAVSGQLAATDPDIGASLTYAAVGDVPAGFALASGGGWTFDANQAEYQALAEGEVRELAISYSVTDEHGASSLSTLTLTIAGANDRPVSTSTAAEVVEGESVSGQLFALDHDNGAELTFAIDGDAPAGFSLGADGGWTLDAAHDAYQALPAGEILIVEVPFTVTDELGATAMSFLTIAVTGTNDAPVPETAPPALPAGTEDMAYVVSQEQLLAGWVDAEGDALIATDLTVDGATVTANADGSFTITPQRNFNGVLQLSYLVTDGAIASSAQAQLVIDPVNDPAVIGGTISGSATEATPFGPGVPAVTGQLSVEDPDDDQLFVPFADAPSSNGYGTVTVDATGSWQYVLDNSNPTVNALNNGLTLSDSFTVTLQDGTAQTIVVTIHGASDAVQPPPPYDTRFDPNDFDAFISGGNPSVSILGTTGNDTIVGSSNNQGFVGREGDDTIWGQAGDDTIYGDAGNDTLYGQSGQDRLEGGTGNNILYGGSGNDSLEGDELGTGADQLFGGSGIDSLFGYRGNDLLIGGFGVDSLTGGQGSDTFRFLDVRDTNDTIFDFVYGTDILDLALLDANQNLDGDQAFGWGGTTPAAYSLWAAQSGTSTVLYADSDGNPATAEFMITLYQNSFSSIAGQVEVPDLFIL